MTRFNRLKKRIKSEKVSNDISFDEISKYLNHYGFYLVRVNGSHHIFNNKDGIQLTIPVHSGKIKQYYVTLVVKIVKGGEKPWH